MIAVIREICALSLLCGAAMSIAPEGSVKKVMNIVCAVILITKLILPIWEFDFSGYSLELAKYRDREKDFLENSTELNEKLSRTVIEQQYAAYILDKAEELGLHAAEVKVGTQWDSGGIWFPYSAEINHEYSVVLSEFIEAELGIPIERQKWKDNNGY